MVPLLSVLIAFTTQVSTITTYGGTLPVEGSSATTVSIGVPEGVCADGAGGVYIASSTHNRIYRVDANGTLNVIAGNGSIGFGGDGGVATAAQLNYVHGLARDRAGNLFIADTNNNRIRKITTDGVITTVAGNGFWSFSGDGGPAIFAGIAGPRDVAVDVWGNLYIADSGNHRIRMVTADGTMSTLAGVGEQGFSGDFGPAVFARLNFPVSVAVDINGRVFVADRQNHRIRMIASGIITTISGSTPGLSGDGGDARFARLSDPRGVDVDEYGWGYVFVVDSGNNRIRLIDPRGIISTIAGNSPGFAGDGNPAVSAQLALPVSVSYDGLGNFYVGDRGNLRVRLVAWDQTMNTVAGTGDEGAPAASAQFNFPNTVAADNGGNVFIADTDGQRIRRISADGIVATIAGNGAEGFSGDGGRATSATLNYPAGVAVDPNGNVFIADTRNNRIRKVTPDGLITTIAASLAEPKALAIDGAGNVIIADSGNHRVFRLDAFGRMTTVAGTGRGGFSGDGGLAIFAQLQGPSGVAVDPSGNIWIADSYNNRVRIVSPDGVIRTVVPDLAFPNGVTVDVSGNLYIADSNYRRIVRRMRDGRVEIFTGADLLSYPFGVSVVDPNTIFIADTFNSRIVKISLSADSP